jgi:hypothetical protein
MKHNSETSKILETYYCNMSLKTIATYATCATSPIYFCNIHVIQLQHTSEIFETIETYNCNIGGREPDLRALGAFGAEAGPRARTGAAAGVAPV